MIQGIRNKIPYLVLRALINMTHPSLGLNLQKTGDLFCLGVREELKTLAQTSVMASTFLRGRFIKIPLLGDFIPGIGTELILVVLRGHQLDIGATYLQKCQN